MHHTVITTQQTGPHLWYLLGGGCRAAVLPRPRTSHCCWSAGTCRDVEGAGGGRTASRRSPRAAAPPEVAGAVATSASCPADCCCCCYCCGVSVVAGASDGWPPIA